MNNIFYKTLLFFAAVILFSSACKKETQQPATFVKVFGDEGIDMPVNAITANDGNYLIVSNHDLENGENTEIQLFKINKNGEQLWKKTYKSDLGIKAAKIVQHTNGDIFIGAAKTISNVISQPWFIITDSEGNEKKSFTIDISSSGGVKDVIAVPDGYIIAALNQITPSKNPQSRLLYLDLNGSLKREITIPANFNGYKFHELISLALMPDGTVSLIGNFSKNAVNQNLKTRLSDPDVLLLNIDYLKTSFLNYTKSFKGNYQLTMYDIELLNNGNYVLAGSTEEPGNGNENIYMIQAKGNDSNALWNKIFLNYRENWIANVTNTPDNKIYGVINSKSAYIIKDDILIVKRYDYSGNEDASFNFTLPRSIGCNVLPLDGGGCIIVAGSILTAEAKNKSDIVIYKVDENGNL